MLRNILITGVTGLVGFHTLKELLNEDNISRIVINIRKIDNIFYDRLSLITKDKKNTNKVIVLEGNILDGDFIFETLVKYEITHIFHFAAQAIVHKAKENPINTLETNVFGTYNVLESAKRYGRIQWILNMSTDKVYGEGLNKPIDYNYQPTDIYSISKISASMLANYYFMNYQLPIYEPRCCNLYGFDQQLSRLIPGTIVRCLHGKKPVVYVNKQNKSGIRQYLYVKDAVKHFIQSMNKGKLGPENIGSNDVFTTVEVVKEIVKHFPEIKGFETKYVDYEEISEQSLLFINKQHYYFENAIEKTIDEFRKYYS